MFSTGVSNTHSSFQSECVTKEGKASATSINWYVKDQRRSFRLRLWYREFLKKKQAGVRKVLDILVFKKSYWSRSRKGYLETFSNLRFHFLYVGKEYQFFVENFSCRRTGKLCLVGNIPPQASPILEGVTLKISERANSKTTRWMLRLPPKNNPKTH